MSTHDNKEVAAIAAELEALGESVPDDIEAELAAARVAGEITSAARAGQAAVEALDAPDAPEALDALHLLRGAAGADTLGAFAHRRGLQRVREQLDVAAPTAKNVIPLWRRGPVQMVLAVAALLALVMGAVLLQPGSVQLPESRVVQAQRHAGEVERAALRQLMAGATPTVPGDHGLRALREARYDVVAARAEARARRL